MQLFFVLAHLKGMTKGGVTFYMSPCYVVWMCWVWWTVRAYMTRAQCGGPWPCAFWLPGSLSSSVCSKASAARARWINTLLLVPMNSTWKLAQSFPSLPYVCLNVCLRWFMWPPPSHTSSSLCWSSEGPRWRARFRALPSTSHQTGAAWLTHRYFWWQTDTRGASFFFFLNALHIMRTICT